jgi:hypothetical protein
LSYTFSCHSSPPTILPSSLTSSCHLFLGLPHGLLVSKFIYTTLLGILFSSILCTCPNQRNLCSLIVSVMVGIFKNCINFYQSSIPVTFIHSFHWHILLFPNSNTCNKLFFIYCLTR